VRMQFALLGDLYLHKQHRLFQGTAEKVVERDGARFRDAVERYSIFYGGAVFGRLHLVECICRSRRCADHSMGV